MPTSDLAPGTITTLGALRPGDVGKFVNEDDTEGSLFLVMHKGIEIGTVRFTDAYDWRQFSCTVRYLGRGRIEPARIVLEGEGRLGNCERCAGTGIYTDNEMQCRDCHGTGCVPDRIAELEAQVRTLREAMEEATSNCRNAGQWCMDRCTDRDSCNVCSPLRNALAATAPKEKYR